MQKHSEFGIGKTDPSANDSKVSAGALLLEQSQMQSPKSGIEPFSKTSAGNAAFGILEDSSFPKISAEKYIGLSALTGAAVESSTWLLDKQLIASNFKPQSNIMQWWQENSSMVKNINQLKENLAISKELVTTRSLETSAASQLKEIRTRSLINLSNDKTILNNALASEPISKQAEFWNKGNFLDESKVASVIGTKEEVLSGNKLFVKGSAEAVTMTDYAKAHSQQQVARIAERSARYQMERAQTLLPEAYSKGAGSLGERVVSGLAKGAMIGAGTLALGYAFDQVTSKAFGSTPPQFNTPGRFLIDGVAIPSIVMSTLPVRYKIAASGTLFAIGHSDNIMNILGGNQTVESPLTMNPLLRPNTTDAVLVTAAAMAPVDGKTKAVLLGAAVIAGRFMNSLENAAERDKVSNQVKIYDTGIIHATNDILQLQMDFIKAPASKFEKTNIAPSQSSLGDYFNKVQQSQNIKAKNDMYIDALEESKKAFFP